MDKEINKELPEDDLIEDRNMLECFLKCFKWTEVQLTGLQSSSHLHTVHITGILNICCHITTMDDNTF